MNAEHGSEPRVFGLDALRAFAVTCVLIAHISVFVPHAQVGRLWFVFGHLGVEVFFVLSGFLIGRILLREPPRNRHEWLRFWGRRWLRTLPPYWLTLIALVLVFSPDASTIARNAAFMQCLELHQRAPRFFAVAWSLAVEEWFYLLLPFVLFAFGTRTRAIAALLVVLTLARWYAVRDLSFDDAKYVTWLRLDTLLWGVVAAAVSLQAPALWQRLRHPAWMCAVPLLVVVVAVLWYAPLSSFTLRAPLFSLTSAAVALLLPAAAQWRVRSTRIARFVVWLAAISYPLYLVHFDVMGALARPWGQWAAVPGIAAALLLAHLIHRFLERPLLAWRDRQPSLAS